VSDLLIFSLAALFVIGILAALCIVKKTPFEAALSLKDGLKMMLGSKPKDP